MTNPNSPDNVNHTAAAGDGEEAQGAKPINFDEWRRNRPRQTGDPAEESGGEGALASPGRVILTPEAEVELMRLIEENDGSVLFEPHRHKQPKSGPKPPPGAA